MQDGNFTITIPAQGVINFNAGDATCFFCLTADAAYSIEPKGERKTPIQAGDSHGKEGGKPFQRIVFRNTTGVAITTEFYLGQREFKGAEQNIGGTVSAVISGTVATDSALKNDITKCVECTPAQFLVTNATPGTPVPLAAVETFFRKAFLFPFKTLSGTNNVGMAKVGYSSAVNEQAVLLSPGDLPTVFEAPQGGKIDFQNIYLDVASAGDGVVIMYF